MCTSTVSEAIVVHKFVDVESGDLMDFKPTDMHVYLQIQTILHVHEGNKCNRTQKCTCYKSVDHVNAF